MFKRNSNTSIHLNHISFKMQNVEDILADTFTLRAIEPITTISQNCRFLNLPRELRDEIYLMVAIHETHLSLKSQDPPGILYVSHQVRSEFSAIYYGEKNMKAMDWDSRSRTWSRIHDPETLCALLCDDDAGLSNLTRDLEVAKAEVEQFRRRSHTPPRLHGVLSLAYDGAGQARVFAKKIG